MFEMYLLHDNAQDISIFFAYLHLYAFVFFATLFGCLLNCLPERIALRFAAVDAAYSDDDKALIAFSGRYLSPVASLP